ncbi:coatomer subunit beta' [Aplysia californica]|uniref:Coatomer subunit beta' n=1 Tax=Aplysia californica TaxID=6500 RepID=A0ABM0JRA2_APLCA|nr:coatomer subunit beta' [Aplysia californica]
MPLRLDIKRKLSARSDRVKSVDLHPSEPWMLASLYNGNIHIWNFESQQLIKSFEVCDLPVRAAKFVARKNWVLSGSDDMHVRVFNYNTLERVHQFEAHSDYLRSIAVHPTQPFILTSSDDMLIKLWDWDKKWTCTQVFEGHTHYVMQIVINPKDNNQFASASLDRTIKVWQLGSPTPNFTLEGHEKGANCVDYYCWGDKPYLISGADDRLVKIWDYQNKMCVQTLEGHAQNVATVAFHPTLPIILTGSEDGTVRIWHANTYRLESTLNYGLERVWTVACQKGSNNVALGYDEGSIIIKLGREEPAMSMDSSGKIIWAKHSEIQQANIKTMGDQEIKDGERLSLAVKDMGSCEIYPQTISHNPNGRFVVVCGDGEYTIYTAMALRNKAFGSAQEFVWSNDSSVYAIREGSTSVKIFKNFKEQKSFKPDFGAEGIYGGNMLGVRSVSGLALYDWETTELVRRIEITPKHIYWSETGELVCIATEDSFFILKYNAEAVENAKESKDAVTEDGVEDAFEVLTEIEESVSTGLWVGDCFIYTNNVNRLNYYVGGEIVTIAHLDRVMYLLGYIPKDNRLYLGDKELNIISFSLLVSVLEYQTAVMRRDFDTADKVLPTVPREQRTRVAHFLEKQGFKSQAMAVTCDPEHKFELSIQLCDLRSAYDLAKESQSEQKWKQLAELAVRRCEFGLAQECLHQAQDYGGLLLLASSAGNKDMVGRLGEAAGKSGQNNVAFLSNFVLGRCEECLEILINTGRLPEAAFFARTYLPSQISRVVSLWKENVAAVSQKSADSLADPTDYENLFPGLRDGFKTEQFLKPQREKVLPAAAYSKITSNAERNPVEEMKQAEESGSFVYAAPIGDDEDGEEEEDFEDVAEKPVVKSEEPVQSPAAPAPTPAALAPTPAAPAPTPAAPVKPAEPAPTPAQETPAAAKQSVEDLEKELELDLENVNIEDLEGADMNLDEDDLLQD